MGPTNTPALSTERLALRRFDAYRYSYEERWQPKNLLVTFRMYQLDLAPGVPTYRGYWDGAAVRLVEPGL